jgi:hypothetical protein
MFGNDRPRVFDSLSGDLNALDLTLRNVHVQERPFRQALAENLPDRDECEARRLSEIEMISRHETDRQARHTEDGGFERTRYRSRVGCVIAKVAAVVDTGRTDIGQLVFAENLVQRQRHTIGWRTVDAPVPFIDLPNPQRPRQRQTV